MVSKTQGRRRAFGQHFLRNERISNEIAETAVQEMKAKSCQSILEIGPGRGAITEPLLRLLKGQELLLVEKDRKLADFWMEKSGVKVISDDFLNLGKKDYLVHPPLAVVSNLPYSAGTQILIQLAKNYLQIPVMVLMFQAEVARRVRAEPSTSDRGSLSVWIQNRWDVRKLISVKPNDFSPPPKVQSEVVLLSRRESPWIDVLEHEEALWEKVLKSAFAHRRKMLRSSFPWQNALALSGVDGKKRAEALDWNEWSQLFQAVRQSSSS